eukprot:jgi/Botrbrau1/19284/Bobra.0073s0027.1
MEVAAAGPFPQLAGPFRAPVPGRLYCKCPCPWTQRFRPTAFPRSRFTFSRTCQPPAAVPTSREAVVRGSNSKPSVDDGCQIFVDEDGEIIEVMCCDYGFRSGFGRLYQGGDGEIPANFLTLGFQNFAKEYAQLRRSFRFNEYREIARANPPRDPISKAAAWLGKKVVVYFSKIDTQLEDAGVFKKLEPNPLPESVLDGDGGLLDECAEIRDKLKNLRLNDKDVWKREEARNGDPERIRPPVVIKVAYLGLCWMLDVVFANRPIQRFWFLETVARMPYFSYISMLHLYESLGWWRAGAELRKIHFAEEWNELHHLQIMEALGGDQLWIDRFLAQHAAIVYYWVLILFFLISPSQSYGFSELIETHAVDTYGQFVDENEELLKSLPPPRVALEYYKAGDMYLYDELQTASRDSLRRPPCRNLYDVFCNIRDDELEHVKTMKACRDYSITDDLAARRLTSSFQSAGSLDSMAMTTGNGNGSSNGNGPAAASAAVPTDGDIKTMDKTQLS